MMYNTKNIKLVESIDLELGHKNNKDKDKNKSLLSTEDNKNNTFKTNIDIIKIKLRTNIESHINNCECFLNEQFKLLDNLIIKYNTIKLNISRKKINLEFETFKSLYQNFFENIKILNQNIKYNFKKIYLNINNTSKLQDNPSISKLGQKSFRYKNISNANRIQSIRKNDNLMKKFDLLKKLKFKNFKLINNYKLN